MGARILSASKTDLVISLFRVVLTSVLIIIIVNKIVLLMIVTITIIRQKYIPGYTQYLSIVYHLQ